MAERDKFHGNVGRFLNGKDAVDRTTRYKRHKEQNQRCAPGSYTRGEFFGINRINKLLGRKDCVGIRIYYGKTYEDKDENPVNEGEGELRSRLVLVGVRADGSDIFDDKTGLKGDGDGDALGDGYSCPRHCAP